MSKDENRSANICKTPHVNKEKNKYKINTQMENCSNNDEHKMLMYKNVNNTDK